MRIDGPRNLEPTAELSGSFSGSFLGKFTNKVADASLSGSFSGSFLGIGTGSFSGSFSGDGSGLGNVFKKVVVAPDGIESILSAQNSGVMIFTSESGAGLRITHQQNQSTPEIVFDLINIPNSSLANSTISGVELGGTLERIVPGTGLLMNAAGGVNYYDGSTERTLTLNPSAFSSVGAGSLASADKLVIADSAAAKLIAVSDFVSTLAGAGLSVTGNSLTLNTDATFTSILNSNGLIVGTNDDSNININSAGQIIIKSSGNTMMTISLGSISIGAGIQFDGLGGTSIKDFKSVTSASSSFQTIQGKWRGVPGSDHSKIENWTRGVPMCFTAERNKNASTNDSSLTGEFNKFAFGNGGSGNGVAMPFAGRVIAATLSFSGPLVDASDDSVTDVKFRMLKNGTLVGSENDAGGRIHIDDGQDDGHGSTINVSSATGGSQVVTGISDPATRFNAGDRITWQCTEITTSDGSFNPQIETTLTLAFWVIFD